MNTAVKRTTATGGILALRPRIAVTMNRGSERRRAETWQQYRGCISAEDQIEGHAEAGPSHHGRAARQPTFNFALSSFTSAAFFIATLADSFGSA